MELFQELLLTAVLAFLFSFIVAKLVSFALGGYAGPSQPESRQRTNFDEDIVVGERELGERLIVKGFESERRVRFVEEAVEKLKEFEDGEEFPKPVLSGEEIVEECVELPEKLEKEEASVADFPEKSSEESFGVETFEMEESGGFKNERGGVTEKEIGPIEADDEPKVSDVESIETKDDAIHVTNEAEEIEESHVTTEAEERAELSNAQTEDISDKDAEARDGKYNSQNEANRDKEAEDRNEKCDAKCEEIRGKEVERADDESDVKYEVIRVNKAEVRDEESYAQAEDIRDEEVEQKGGEADPQTEGIGLEGYGQKEVLLSDDDDWEGIEKTELEKDFAAAAKFVASEHGNEKLSTFGSDVLMELYGLNKVATEGPCREPQPMALMVSSRAKWNAWQRLGNMSPDIAMEQYVALLSAQVPEWNEETSVGDTEVCASAGAKPALDPNLSIYTCHQPQPTVESQRNLDLGDPREATDLEPRLSND